MSEALRTLHAEPLRRFKRYPAYRDSGVEWLGEVPAHWDALKLKRVCSFSYGESLASDARIDGEVEVYGSNGPVGVHDRANTLSPCLVIGRKGSFGKVNYSAAPVFAIDTTFFVDRRATRANLRWLYYALMDARLDAATKDSAIPGLDREDAYARVLCVPPDHEQRAIAAFLDRETARIDALVAKKERLIELLQEKRTALITRAVTKGLDPTVPMKDSGVEWLGEIPAHWEVKRVKHVTTKIGSGKTPTGGAEVYVSEGVMLIRSQNVHFGGLVLDDVAYIDSETDAQMAGSRVQDGDVLLNITGASLGRCCVARLGDKRANVNQHVCVIRPKGAAYISEFLAAALASHSGQAQVFTTENGISRDALNFEQIGELVVPQPLLEEQRAIAVRLESQAARIDALLAKVRDAIDRLKELRTALISAAVTGKIDVREEAP